MILGFRPVEKPHGYPSTSSPSSPRPTEIGHGFPEQILTQQRSPGIHSATVLVLSLKKKRSCDSLGWENNSQRVCKGQNASQRFASRRPGRRRNANAAHKRTKCWCDNIWKHPGWFNSDSQTFRISGIWQIVDDLQFECPAGLSSIHQGRRKVNRKTLKSWLVHSW